MINWDAHFLFLCWRHKDTKQSKGKRLNMSVNWFWEFVSLSKRIYSSFTNAFWTVNRSSRRTYKRILKEKNNWTQNDLLKSVYKQSTGRKSFQLTGSLYHNSTITCIQTSHDLFQISFIWLSSSKTDKLELSIGDGREEGGALGGFESPSLIALWPLTPFDLGKRRVGAVIGGRWNVRGTGKGGGELSRDKDGAYNQREYRKLELRPLPPAPSRGPPVEPSFPAPSNMRYRYVRSDDGGACLVG